MGFDDGSVADSVIPGARMHPLYVLLGIFCTILFSGSRILNEVSGTSAFGRRTSSFFIVNPMDTTLFPYACLCAPALTREARIRRF